MINNSRWITISRYYVSEKEIRDEIAMLYKQLSVTKHEFDLIIDTSVVASKFTSNATVWSTACSW